MRPHTPPMKFNLGGKTITGRIDRSKKTIVLEGLDDYALNCLENVEQEPVPTDALLVCTMQCDSKYNGYFTFCWGHSIDNSGQSVMQRPELDVVEWRNNLDSILDSNELGMPFLIGVATVANVAESTGKRVGIRLATVRDGVRTVLADGIVQDDIELPADTYHEFYVY
jgi:hypothetical protein